MTPEIHIFGDMGKSDNYITLKEAAEISGYAPDYVGQLIRSGKLEGKQVYSNVAWVTTEEAIREYADRAKRGKAGSSSTGPSASSRFLDASSMKRLVKALSYVLIGIGVLFGILLFYMLSVSIDHRLEERAKAKAEERALNVPPISDEDPHVPL